MDHLFWTIGPVDSRQQNRNGANFALGAQDSSESAYAPIQSWFWPGWVTVLRRSRWTHTLIWCRRPTVTQRKNSPNCVTLEPNWHIVRWTIVHRAV